MMASPSQSSSNLGSETSSSHLHDNRRLEDSERARLQVLPGWHDMDTVIPARMQPNHWSAGIISGLYRLATRYGLDCAQTVEHLREQSPKRSQRMTAFQIFLLFENLETRAILARMPNGALHTFQNNARQQAVARIRKLPGWHSFNGGTDTRTTQIWAPDLLCSFYVLATRTRIDRDTAWELLSLRTATFTQPVTSAHIEAIIQKHETDLASGESNSLRTDHSPSHRSFIRFARRLKDLPGWQAFPYSIPAEMRQNRISESSINSLSVLAHNYALTCAQVVEHMRAFDATDLLPIHAEMVMQDLESKQADTNPARAHRPATIEPQPQPLRPDHGPQPQVALATLPNAELKRFRVVPGWRCFPGAAPPFMATVSRKTLSLLHGFAVKSGADWRRAIEMLAAVCDGGRTRLMPGHLVRVLAELDLRDETRAERDREAAAVGEMCLVDVGPVTPSGSGEGPLVAIGSEPKTTRGGEVDPNFSLIDCQEGVELVNVPLGPVAPSTSGGVGDAQRVDQIGDENMERKGIVTVIAQWLLFWLFFAELD